MPHLSASPTDILGRRGVFQSPGNLEAEEIKRPTLLVITLAWLLPYHHLRVLLYCGLLLALSLGAMVAASLIEQRLNNHSPA